MRQCTEEAYAKINLTLDILGLRPDGYHKMDMVMQSVSLSDTLCISLEEEPGVRFRSTRGDLPSDRRNLAVDAAYRFLEARGLPQQGVSIVLEKRIPVCAGTAGGSSDAAAVLRGLNRLTGEALSQEALMDLGALVGSDVPYCVMGGTARARGRGELLEKLSPVPSSFFVLCKPSFSVSTPELFRRFDTQTVTERPNTEAMIKALEAGDLQRVASQLWNVFEEVLPAREQMVVKGIRDRLTHLGAIGASMSGTGPTVFGLFDREDLARAAAAKLGEDFPEVFLTKAV